jgi:subtilisin family serine protease
LTSGSFTDDSGARHPDNILKPDLVAPGNRVLGAVSTDKLGLLKSGLALAFPQLVVQSGLGTGLIVASGTSYAAPVVSGTAALLLQANPGLTPALVKAILQYTAEPLPGFNLLQQGTGLVNAPGALAVASHEYGNRLPVLQYRSIGEHLGKHRVERLDHFGFRKLLRDLLCRGGDVSECQA